jgi:hypothetical protein
MSFLRVLSAADAQSVCLYLAPYVCQRAMVEWASILVDARYVASSICVLASAACLSCDCHLLPMLEH